MTDILIRVIRTTHLEMITVADGKLIIRRRRSKREHSLLFGHLNHPATFYRLPEAWLPEYEDILDQVMEDELKQRMQVRDEQ